MEMRFILAKSAYFFATGSKYALLSFLVLFLTENKMDVQKAGIITATRYAVEVVGAIILNILTDRFKSFAYLIIVCFILIETSIIVLFPWLPALISDVNFLYRMFILCNGFIAFFEGGIIAAIDTHVISLSKEVSENTFILQRRWGSFGIGLIPFLTGIAIEETKGVKFGQHTLFYIVGGSNLILLIACFWLFRIKTKEQKSEKNQNEISESKQINWENQKKSVLQALKNGNNWIALFAYMSMGIAMMFLYTFVFLLLKNELNISNIFMGLAAFIQALSEIIFAKAGTVISAYFRHELFAISIAFLLSSICFVTYYFANHIAIMFLVNVGMGCAYSSFLYPATDMIYKNTDSLSRGVLYGMALAFLGGIGGCFAGILGGYLFEKYGGRKTFFFGAGLFLFLGIVFMCLYFYIRFSEKKKERSNNNNNNIEEITVSENHEAVASQIA